LRVARVLLDDRLATESQTILNELRALSGDLTKAAENVGETTTQIYTKVGARLANK